MLRGSGADMRAGEDFIGEGQEGFLLREKLLNSPQPGWAGAARPTGFSQVPVSDEVRSSQPSFLSAKAHQGQELGSCDVICLQALQPSRRGTCVCSASHWRRQWPTQRHFCI